MEDAPAPAATPAPAPAVVPAAAADDDDDESGELFYTFAMTRCHSRFLARFEHLSPGFLGRINIWQNISLI